MMVTAKARPRIIILPLLVRHYLLLLLLVLVDIHALTVPVSYKDNNVNMAHFNRSSSSSSSNSNSNSNSNTRKQQTRPRNKAVPIIACVSGIEVKRAASFYLRPGDRILEFGTMLSHVSEHFLRTIGPTGHAVLVNIKHSGNGENAKSGRSGYRNPTPFLGQHHGRGSSSMEETSHYNEHNNNNDDVADEVENDLSITRNQQESFVDQVDFVELDQFDDWRTLLFSKAVAETGDKNAATPPPAVAAAIVAAAQQQQQQHFDVVFVNVGAMIGNDLHLTALSMAHEFLKQTAASSPPRVMIINSRSLSSLARRLHHGQQIVDGMIEIPKPCAMQRSPAPYIIATVGVQEYRSTIPFVVQPGDEVLEVGCHSGMTTSLLHQHASAAGRSSSTSDAQSNTKQQHGVPGFCIGVDIGPRIVESARKQNPDIPFAVGDAWKTLQLLQLKHTLIPTSLPSSLASASSRLLGYDAVYADIGGLSGADGLLESISLLEALGYGLEPRCIVIKSLCMKRLASQLKSFTNVWEKIRNDRHEEEEEVVVVESVE